MRASESLVFLCVGVVALYNVRLSLTLRNYESTAGTFEPTLNTTFVNNSFNGVSDADNHLPTPWNCHQADLPHKIVVVHVFKTAGTTLRELLWRYAQRCQVGYLAVSGCAGLSPNTTTWTNIFQNNTCLQERRISATGTAYERDYIYPDIVQHQVNLIMGHLPLGVPSLNDNSQYVTFVRHPQTKYISGVLYSHPRWTLSQAVQTITQRLEKAHREDLYYQGYSNYFLTPTQKWQLAQENSNNTIQHRIELVLNNLREYKVIVGVVERMSSSMGLLQYLLDGDDRVGDLWKSVQVGENSSSLALNRGRLDTATVLQEIGRNATLLEYLDEFLRYDYMVYDLATSIHEEQYAWLHQKQIS